MPKVSVFCMLTQCLNEQNYICTGNFTFALAKLCLQWAKLHFHCQIFCQNDISVVKSIFAWAKFYFHGHIMFPWPNYNSIQ